MYNYLLKLKLFSIAICSIFILAQCSKSDNNTPIDTTAFFNNNVLNKDLTIHFATDNSVNVTSTYGAYTFRCASGGAFSATNSLFTITGTWVANADYSKVTFNLPTPPNEFIFLNREWTFTKYTTPIMELAPALSTDNKVLHFQRQ